MAREAATGARVGEAYQAVKFFEDTHCLALHNMGYIYLEERARLVALALQVAQTCHIQVWT